MTTVGGVKTEAQLERERVARQAREAVLESERQATEVRGQVAAQAEEASQKAAAQAREAQEKTRLEALTQQAIVRRAQGEAEREVEAAKGQAREARQRELRKQDLPFTRPERAVVNIEGYIVSVESSRAKAHKEGRSARGEIERIKDEYVAQVDKELSEALADIDKQKLDIEADIARQLMEAQAEIVKQVAILNSGINEWEADAIIQLNKAEAEYNALLKGIAPYKLGDGYDLTAMVQAGYSKDTLLTYGFAIDDIKVAENYIKALKDIAPYKEGDSYNLVAMIQAGYSEDTLKTYGFTIEGIKLANDTIKALKDIAPFKLEGNNYDITHAIIAANKGEIPIASLVLLFGDDAIEGARGGVRQVETYDTYKAYINEDETINVSGLIIKYGAEKTQVILTDLGVENPYHAVKMIDDPEYAFDYMKATGEIRASAKYVGYDEKTAEIMYVDEPTEDDWRKLYFKQPYNIRLSYIFRQAPYLGERQWHQLSDKEKRQVITDFSKEYSYLDSVLSLTKAEQQALAKRRVIGYVPAYGTKYNWSYMSEAERVISIALDIAIIFPLIRSGVSALRAARAPIIAKAGQLARGETLLAKQMAKTLSTAYATPSKVKGLAISNRALASSYTNMIKAQAKYLKQLAKTEGRVLSGKAKFALSKAEINLRAKASIFVKNLYRAESFIKGVKEIPVRFDSAEVRSLINSLPNEIVQNTKAAIRALAGTSTNVKALTKAVSRAKAALSAAKAKYPTDASKWTDLIFEVTRAEGRLAQAQLGSLNALYKRLLVVRGMAAEVPSLTKQLVQARKSGNASWIRQLREKLQLAIKSQGEAKRLQVQFDNAVKSMEVEWGRLGFFSGKRGGVATLDIKPLSSTDRGSPLDIAKKTGVSRLIGTIGLGGRMLTIPKSVGKPETTTTKPMTIMTPDVIREAKATPEVVTITTSVPKVSGVTDVEILNLSQIALDVATEAIAQNITGTELHQAVEEAVQAETQLQPKPATKAQVKAITKAAIKVAIKFKMKLRVRIKPSEGKPKRDKQGRLIYADGTVVWLMGNHWKIIPPPYTLLKPIDSLVAPHGVKRLDGTPQETLCFIGGKLPFRNVSFDLGIVDGWIDVKKKKITFTGQGMRTDVGKRIPSTTTGITLGDVGDIKLTEEQLRGAIARRQGAFFVTVYPPYGEKDVIWTKQPIKGVRVVTGEGSAYKSITRLGGQVPKVIKLPLGIMTTEIRTPKRGQPKILFTRRNGQKHTRQTPSQTVSVGGK